MSEPKGGSIEIRGQVVNFEYDNGIKYFNVTQACKVFMVKEGKRRYNRAGVFLRLFLSGNNIFNFNVQWEKSKNPNFEVKNRRKLFSTPEWISFGAIGIKTRNGSNGCVLFNEDLFKLFVEKYDKEVYEKLFCSIDLQMMDLNQLPTNLQSASLPLS